MKLLEKMADEYARPTFNGHKMHDGPMQRSLEAAFIAGFKAAREMAKQRLQNGYDIGFWHGDHSTMLRVFEDLGEKEIKPAEKGI